jgi:hypothetical protein
MVLSCYDSFYLLLACFSSLIVKSSSVTTFYLNLKETNNATIGRRTMADEKVQDYFKDDTDGHVDTRDANKECEKPDPNLGCDPGIDVAG